MGLIWFNDSINVLGFEMQSTFFRSTDDTELVGRVDILVDGATPAFQGQSREKWVAGNFLKKQYQSCILQ